ncbi:hypothetical protein ABLN86_06855, partial [Mycobacterium tuberculosis]
LYFVQLSNLDCFNRRAPFIDFRFFAFIVETLFAFFVRRFQPADLEINGGPSRASRVKEAGRL